MRRILLLLFCLLSTLPGFAQSLAKTFTLSADHQNACIGTSGLPTIGIDLSGTSSLTLQPQVSINGSAPKTSSVTSTVAGSAPQATIVTSGSTSASYVAPVGGFDTFCLNVSAYTSGTATIQLNPSPALNASLFAPAAPGTVTSVFSRTGAVVAVADDYAAVPGLDLGDGTSVIDFDTVDGILGFGDQPGSPEPGSDDDCVLGPYVTGASSNGIVCTGANGSNLSIDNEDGAFENATGITLATGSTGEILLQAGVNDSQQLTNGWYSSGVMTSDMHALITRCAAVGSAASPSVVDCQTGCGGVLGCSGGAFSCATNASGATCVIDTHRVCVDSGGGCANLLQTTSTIFVSQVTDEGGVLGVTCNTTPTSALVSARSNGTSFTITLGTFAVNPLCFNFIIN